MGFLHRNCAPLCVLLSRVMSASKTPLRNSNNHKQWWLWRRWTCQQGVIYLDSSMASDLSSPVTVAAPRQLAYHGCSF